MWQSGTSLVFIHTARDCSVANWHGAALSSQGSQRRIAAIMQGVLRQELPLRASSYESRSKFTGYANMAQHFGTATLSISVAHSFAITSSHASAVILWLNCGTPGCHIFSAQVRMLRYVQRPSKHLAILYKHMAALNFHPVATVIEVDAVIAVK